MICTRARQVDFSREIPADIQSAYLRHTVHIQFTHQPPYLMGVDLWGAQFDDLTAWCNENCQSVFSATKITVNTAAFRFYLLDDLVSFEKLLAITVVPTTDSAT